MRGVALGGVASAPLLACPFLAHPWVTCSLAGTTLLTLPALPQPTWKVQVTAALVRIILKNSFFFPLIF